MKVPNPSKTSVAGSGVIRLSGAVPRPKANSGEMSDSVNPATPEKVKAAVSLTRWVGFVSDRVVIWPV